MPWSITQLVLTIAVSAHLGASQTTMWAIEANKYASNLSAVFINNTAAVPSLAVGEVLLKVEGSSINPIDWKVLDGQIAKIFPLSFPAQVLGSDVVGIVHQSRTARFTVGDHVWGDLGSGSNDRGRTGPWAEYVAVPAFKLSTLPTGASNTAPELATLPLVSKTMWQALEVAGFTPHAPRTNMTVVVTSGTGGTGTVGVQLAKALGATKVVTTAGDVKGVALMTQLGADLVVNYHDADLFDVLGPDSVDIIIDNFGYDADAAINALRGGGSFVSLTHTSPNSTKPGVRAFEITCNVRPPLLP